MHADNSVSAAPFTRLVPLRSVDISLLDDGDDDGDAETRYRFDLESEPTQLSLC